MGDQFPQGSSIYIYEDELSFIEKLLEVKSIKKECLDKQQNILNLNNHYVGYIKTNRRLIEIVPKNNEIHLNHILRIYFFVHGDYHNLNDEIFSLTNDIFNSSLINLFLNELEKVIYKGLPTEYVSFSQNQKFIHGKVNYTQSYKNILLYNKEPFYTEVDQLSLDTSLNRVLKAAFNKVKNIAENKEGLSKINKYLYNIPNNYNKRDLTDVIINTKNYYCKNAFLYAKLILEESYYDSIGNFSGESLLINSDLLFELFIKKILFNLSIDQHFQEWKNTQPYGEYKNISKEYKPDILYNYSRSKNNAIAVIDVKNKFNTIFKNADVYQMVFYSTMLHSKKSILCYPSTFYKSPETLEIYSKDLSSNKIYAVFINICESSRTSFSESIDKFIRDLYLTIY